MANTSSAKKQARQNKKRNIKNLTRSTAIKTAIKKLLSATDKPNSEHDINEMLRAVQSKLARAQGKGIMHKNTIRRKISRLARHVQNTQKEAKPAA